MGKKGTAQIGLLRAPSSLGLNPFRDGSVLNKDNRLGVA